MATSEGTENATEEWSAGLATILVMGLALLCMSFTTLGVND